MPAQTPANGYSLAIESHEERLQRVEGTLQEVSVQVGKVETKQDVLSGQIQAGFDRLGDSLDKIHARTESLSAAHEDLKDRLVPLEAGNAVSQERRSVMKSIWIGVLLAAAGGLATKGGEFIWELISK